MPGTSLFRQGVVEVRRGERAGSIVVAAPLSRWLLTALVVALATAFLLFLVFGHYTRRETVTGELAPSAGLLNVMAPRAGTIAKLHVHDGQRVGAGDVLVELSSNQDSAALGDTRALVGQELDAQRARLQADLTDQQQLAHQQASALQGQLTQIDAQLDIAQKQVTSNQHLLPRIEPLGAALQQWAQLPLDAATKRNYAERQLASVTHSIAQNELQRATVLRAPSDGIVSAVLPKQGQMVSAGHSLLSILPAGSTLQARLLVPSRAIGLIDPGSRVVQRYEEFPYQKFGQQYGHVTDVSRSALSTSEVAALIDQQSQQPLYRVQVKLDKQLVLAYGYDEPVRPSMALQPDILMDRSSLLKWVFEPLYCMVHHLAGGLAHG